jgi:glycosyl transferase family 87
MLNAPGQGVAPLARAAVTSRLWLALGLANLVAGVVIALRPDQSFDVAKVAGWCRDWLIHGVNPYPGSAVPTNYPPYALTLLAPLALVPSGLLKLVWAAASVGLAAAAGWLGLQSIATARTGLHLARPSIGFFLAWESVRIGLDLGQFTLLALVCGLAAVLYQGKIGRGILLGVAMIKPQVGVAFVLWALLEGSLAAVLWATVPAILGTVLFAARLALSPITVVALYGSVLREELVAPGFREGALELRPLIHDLIPQPTMADAIHLAIVAGSLALLVVVSRRISRDSRVLFLLPLTCVWTLMSVYHPTYDLVLLWPAAVAIAAWISDRRPQAAVAIALLAVQLALVVDVPGLWWKLSGRPFPAPDDGWLTAAMMHFDRLLVVGIFAALTTLAMRWRPARESVMLPNQPIPVS